MVPLQQFQSLISTSLYTSANEKRHYSYIEEVSMFRTN